MYGEGCKLEKWKKKPMTKPLFNILLNTQFRVLGIHNFAIEMNWVFLFFSRVNDILSYPMSAHLQLFSKEKSYVSALIKKIVVH